MKPTFALDLSRDQIALLHRTPKGWLVIGEVAFGAPDMAEALDYLRKTALGLSPMGVATKIILPNSQILYTEVHAPGPSRDDKRRQIAAALEGRTPYAVEDLVFDWSGKGQTVKVAVVARETLAEAEGFAVANLLNPVSFVAIPDSGNFVGEPWFGPTAAAETLLAPGETVDRDREPVTFLQREASAPPPPPPASAHTTGGTTPVPEEDPLPGLEKALTADLPNAETRVNMAAGAAASGSGLGSPDLDDLTPDQAAEVAAADVFAAEFARTPEPVVADPMIRADPAAPGMAASAKPVPSRAEPEVEEAPFAHVTDSAAFPDGEDDGPPASKPPAAGPPKIAVAAPADDVPTAPHSPAMMAFASRPAATPVPGKPVEGATRPGPVAASPAARRLATPDSLQTPAKGFAGLVTASSIPGTRTKPKGKLTRAEIARPTAPGPTTIKSPARPGGTFGTAAPPRNRGAVVFMVMVALLLLFLAAIAAWSSYYLARNGQTETEAVIVADQVVPGVDDEMLADMQDPEGMDALLPEAAGMATGLAEDLATERAPINLALEDDPAAMAEVAPDETVVEPAVADLGDTAVADAVTDPQSAPEPAPGVAITTDFAAGQQPAEDQDEIFLSAMDAPPSTLDALALPAPAATSDTAPEAPMPPPPFGTVYRFGPDGLLVPTPDGILSPEGVMLIAGPPPLVPPSRSQAATALAATAAAAPVLPEAPGVQTPVADAASPVDPAALAAIAEASLVTTGASLVEGVVPTPSDPAMAGFRPRARPEGLVPLSPEDGARLQPAFDNAAFAALRPLPRPESVLTAASASRSAVLPQDLGAQGASLTAQAEAQLAAAAALEAANPSVVAISKRPAARPGDLSGAVEAAVAAAVRTPEPAPEEVAAAAPAPDLKPEELAELDEPETAASAPKKIPTKASVATQATFANAIRLSKVNLIGTYGTDSKRTALVRQANGRYKKVKVGDKIDGGTIKAITETEVRYQKGGKLLTLKMPKA